MEKTRQNVANGFLSPSVYVLRQPGLAFLADCSQFSVPLVFLKALYFYMNNIWEIVLLKKKNWFSLENLTLEFKASYDFINNNTIFTMNLENQSLISRRSIVDNIYFYLSNFTVLSCLRLAAARHGGCFLFAPRCLRRWLRRQGEVKGGNMQLMWSATMMWMFSLCLYYIERAYE